MLGSGLPRTSTLMLSILKIHGLLIHGLQATADHSRLHHDGLRSLLLEQLLGHLTAMP